jgi:hypothetical protein
MVYLGGQPPHGGKECVSSALLARLAGEIQEVAQKCAARLYEKERVTAEIQLWRNMRPTGRPRRIDPG